MLFLRRTRFLAKPWLYLLFNFTACLATFGQPIDYSEAEVCPVGYSHEIKTLDGGPIVPYGIAADAFS